MSLSRRSFVGSFSAALGYLGLGRNTDLWAQAPAPTSAVHPPLKIARLHGNENPYGPPEAVMKAMNSVWQWANRYQAPDGGLSQAIQQLHGVTAENIILGCGSGEILDVVGTTFLLGGKKVLGVEPTYSSVYQHATRIKSTAIKVPLNKDYTQNIPALIETANKRATEIGFIYLVNPNNPTGLIVPRDEVQQLLDGIPKDMPVLIDEAYHHFVDNPKYESSMHYVLEGRQVIVCRTFSKIAGLAAMRLGYGIAPASLIQKMRPFENGSQCVQVKFGGAASIADTAGQAKVKALNTQVRNKTMGELKELGYEVIPSDANFFMVGVRRDVEALAEEFLKHDILVGRRFPPMTQHLRVSVGTQDEMNRFMAAFKTIMAAGKTTAGAA
jgi:histidinol-phosphate aminotransferase